MGDIGSIRHLLSVSDNNSGEGSAYINDFDRVAFLNRLLEYGIVLFVTLGLGFIILNLMNFQITLIPSWLALQRKLKYKFYLPSFDKLDKSISWIAVILFTLIIITPIVFLLLWGIFVYVTINHLLGISIFLIGLSSILIYFSFFSWRGNGWRINLQAKISFIIAIICIFIFELWTIFLSKPFSYLAVSCVFIGFNCIPQFLLTYNLASSLTKPANKYKALNNTLQQDILLVQSINDNNNNTNANSNLIVQDEKKTEIDEKKDLNVVNNNNNSNPNKLSELVSWADKLDLSNRTMNIIYYSMAFLILLAYGLVILLGRDNNNRVGFITMGVLMVLDLTIFLCVLSGQISSPLNTCIYQLICRIIIVLFGDEYFFTGHSVMYIVLSVFFARCIIDHYVPIKTKRTDTTTTIQQFIQPSPAIQPINNDNTNNNNVGNNNNIVSNLVDTPTNNSANVQLASLGYIKYGKWSKTRWGQVLLRYTHITALTLLTAAFLIDLLISWSSNQIEIQLQYPQKQWIAGVLAIFLSLLICFLIVLHRLYFNADYTITYRVLLSSLTLWSISIICGGYLFHFTRSVILISCFIYVPPMIYTLYYCYNAWVKNDYHVFMDNKQNNNNKSNNTNNTNNNNANTSDNNNNNNNTNNNNNNNNNNSTNNNSVAGSEIALIQVEEKKEEKKQVTIIIDNNTNNNTKPINTEKSGQSADNKDNNCDTKDESKSPVSRIDIAVSLPNNITKYTNKYTSRYNICISAIIFTLLTIGLGLTIGIHSNPSYVGYSITAVILILLSTIIPVIEWFNSFEIGKNMIVQLIITTLSFIGYLLLMWLDAFNGDNSFSSIVLLFLLFVYPTSVIMLFAIYKWSDDKWVISPFVRNCLIICCCLVIALFCALIAVVEPWEIGATLLVCFCLGLLVVLLGPILKARYPSSIKYIGIFSICVLIAYTLAVAFQPHNGFIGFSMGWAILFVGFCVLAYKSHRHTSKIAQHSYFYSSTVLPVYEYDLTPGLKNPLTINNLRVYYVYGLLTITAFWGVVAVFFIEYTWIGVGILALSSCAIILYTLECSNKTLFLIASAVKYLEEDSAKYHSAVKKAKLIALKAQLNATKAINIDPNAKRNKGNKNKNNTKNSEIKSNDDAKIIDDNADNNIGPLVESNGKGAVNNGDAEADLDIDENYMLSESEYIELGLEIVDIEANKNNEQIEHDRLIKVYNELSKLVPRYTFITCGARYVSPKIKYNNHEFSRLTALELLLKLNYAIVQAYHVENKYKTHLQIEIILAVNAMKIEQEQLIMQMLHDTGNLNVTADYIHKLKPNSPERTKLESALKVWLQQQQIIIAERQRKKKEEEEKHRIREEEERLRIEAEEANKLEQLKQNLVAKVDESVLEQQKKEKEEQLRLLQLRKEEEQRKLEEERKAEEARLSALLFQQQQFDCERKRREEEEQQKLIQQKKQQELEALKVLQEQQARELQEQQRLAQLKLETERKAKEEAAKQVERLAKEKADQLILSATSANMCTITATGNNFTVQQWFECITCNLINGAGCCIICRDVCHKGHQVRSGPNSPSPFYCDCGANKCLSCLTPDKRVVSNSASSKTQQTVETIIKHCESTRQQFVDPEFPPSQQALIRDANSNKRHDWLRYEWRRPEQMYNCKSPAIVTDNLDPNDIRQGQIGDCWFMSALSVLTLRQTDLQAVFVTKQHNPHGVYSVNFHKNGQVINVIVDSLFPCDRNGSPAFGHSNDPNELWVMILEKAYAKLHRNYESIESGFVDQALVDLSGGIGGRMDMSKDEVKQQIRNGTLFQSLLNYRTNGYLLGAGSPAGSDSETNASASGIVQGHAYSILDVQEVDGLQFIRLRNPWGRKEWTGDYSDKSDKWTRRLKAKLNYVDADDGSFWMCFQDFTLHFEDIYICRFFDASAGWYEYKDELDKSSGIKSSWNSSNGGGCTNFDTCRKSPQYLLTITQPTNILINLSQADVRGTSAKLKAISIEIYSNKGRRVTKEICGRLVCSNPESYIFRREVNCEALLQPSAEPYTVLISTFNPNEYSDFALKLYSTQPVKFQLAPL